MARRYISTNTGVIDRPKFELTALIDVIFILLLFLRLARALIKTKKHYR